MSKPESTRILLIEDEPGLLEVLALNLRAAGYQVDTARDGLEAWQLYEAAPPDVMVLDLGLPTISGFRLLELVRDTLAPPPVIVITCLDFEEAQEVARYGVAGFITKPFEPKSLLRQVEYVLARCHPAH
ncbi:MAG: response regulator [Chloroflexi bacterium]|nr:response regulator [Chloroflexota bacterium]MBU1747476.1 response regulator [Chloroflexota bacterium]MBU1879750.1 response regulator [Chloroflexota bacterium]